MTTELTGRASLVLQHVAVEAVLVHQERSICGMVQ